MDDEFKLCWKNFQDNIASGFQNLYDRGDLVDVTLACDGKLLHAHKIVLAICSPYFQEIFITNPCKHPIIILKDVHFNIMCELLEFMYQGVVNVKHTELQSFMKMGQLLQIKGLATNSSAASTLSSTNEIQNPTDFVSCINTDSTNNSNFPNEVKNLENTNKSETNTSSKTTKEPSVSPAPSSPLNTNQNTKDSVENNALRTLQSTLNLKRNSEINTDSLAIFSKKHYRRSGSVSEHNAASEQNDDNDVGMEHVNPEDFFLSTIPHISMNESRYELNSVKRESEHSNNSATTSAMRNSSFGSSFGFEYNMYKNMSGSQSGGVDFPSDLHMANDYSKNFGNHMDIPPSSSNVTMLSSTSLLHGNCVFNRNNTVATQQGMKTYWLCKSYRISMCRARCITHQGRVISATGVHNHPPHMRNGPGGCSDNYATDISQLIGGQTALPSLVATSNDVGNATTSANLQHNRAANANNSGMAYSGNLRSSQATTNLFQHSLSSTHSNIQQQHQQNHNVPPHSQSISTSTPTSVSAHMHHHHPLQHMAPPHPNLMVQQQLNSHLMNSQALLLGNPESIAALPPSAAESQNSVIQNMMHNENLLHHQHQQQQLHHASSLKSMSMQHARLHLAPHQHDEQQESLHPSLVIMPANTQSTSLLCSPTSQNKSLHSSMESPSSGGRTLNSSPTIIRPTDHIENCSSEHLSDKNGAQSAARTIGDKNVSSSSKSEIRPSAAEQRSQVTESITLCPDSSHNFKIENI